MSFLTPEKIGIIDLLKAEQKNVGILFQLAKSVTKSMTKINTEDEALECIFLYTSDISMLLNKRLITKEMLFRYLHKKKVPLTTDFTKATLIKKVIDYWHQTYGQETATTNGYTTTSRSNITTTATHEEVNEAAIFPIHLLARKFSEWFFDNYNKDSLKLNDFWTDACLLLEIIANDGIDEQTCEDSTTLLQTLVETRKRFGFYFNPNLTHAGVQGRMDVHGLVLVLACGTLHTKDECVGVFECVFGLLRDPFAENNWKAKNIKLILRSKGAPTMPSLESSDGLKDALELPVPQGELT